MEQNFSQKNLGHVLEAKAHEYPKKLAFTYLMNGEDQEATLTYEQLDKRARGVAIHLRKMTRPGDRVLLVFPPGIDFIVGLYGCFYAGVVAVPIFPPQPGKLKSTLALFENTARDAQCRLVLCDQLVYSKRTFLAFMAKGLRGFHWVNVAKINEQNVESFEIHKGSTGDLAFLLYTSGSTGDPTGVMLTHQNVIENFKTYYDERVTVSGSDPTQERGFSWLPPYHVAGLLFGILFPVYVGSSNILMSPLDFLAKPIRWLKGISRYRVVLSGGPNSGYDYCVDRISPEEREGLDLSCWKYALNGSEPVRPPTLKRFSETYAPYGFHPDSFQTIYGLTETANIVSTNDPGVKPLALSFSKDDLTRHKVREVSPNDTDAQVLLSNGKVFRRLEIKIVDPDTRRPSPPDHVGEIWLKGPTIAAGYWNRDGQTQRVFGAILSSSHEGPFFRTGDLGFVYRGELFISGRLKEMVIIRGKNFFPQDIENSIAVSNPLLEPEGIAAFSAEVEGEEQLIVVAECAKSKDADLQRTMDLIHESLSKNFGLQAHAVVLIKPGTLPRTSTLKTRRRACRDLFLAGELKIVAQWSRGKPASLSAPPEHRDLISLPQNDQELETFFIKKISSLLGLEPEQLDFHHSLPSYGLDSLGAVELSHFLEVHLKIRLGIGPLFESPTIASLFEEVKNQWHRVQTEGEPRAERLDLLKESALPDSISFVQLPADPTAPIFLTGATGFLGAFLLERLLRETTTEIYCLVRAKNSEEGARRIRENLEYFSVWDPSFTSRVRPVLGDLAKTALGIGESAFEELAGQISSIYHCGANVNFIYSYRDLKPINVNGTLEIIRLAGTKKTKPLHYISTVGIFPIWGDENGKSFKEGDAPTLWEGHFSGYALTKWVAERLVFQARERGLPATVYRVGEVIGHSETGICKPDKDAYSNLLKGALMMGAVPRLNMNIYFAPVDMVAKGVIFLSGKKDSLGKTFHLFLNSIDGAGLIDLINSWNHKVAIKSYPEFLKDMESLNQDLPHNPLAPFMPLIRSPIIHELSKRKSILKLDSKSTLKELKKGSIPCPPVHQAVKTYFNYLEKIGFLD